MSAALGRKGSAGLRSLGLHRRCLIRSIISRHARPITCTYHFKKRVPQFVERLQRLLRRSQAGRDMGSGSIVDREDVPAELTERLGLTDSSVYAYAKGDGRRRRDKAVLDGTHRPATKPWPRHL